MTDFELYRPHIESAARDLASTYAHELNAYKVSCPGIDIACRKIACELVANGLVSPQTMLDFLNNRAKYRAMSDIWWK